MDVIIMIRSFKTQVHPTTRQRAEFEKAFGTRRWCWNKGLELFEKHYAEGKFSSAYSLDKEINELRLTDPDHYGWIGDTNTMIKSEALKDLGLAYNAFAKRKKAEAKKPSESGKKTKGGPKFKSKRYCEESFRLVMKNSAALRVKSDYHFSFVWSRKYNGEKDHRITILTSESVAFLRNADIKTITITKKCGKYYMSVTYERTNQKLRRGVGKVGCDIGIKHEVVTYDGKKCVVFDIPESIKRYEHLQDERNKRLSRKDYGSKSYEKQKRLCDKACEKQARIRRDFIHNVTTMLATKYSEIMVDDFSFKEYEKQTSNARHAYRVAPCTLKLLLTYKCEEFGAKLIYVPQFTPTTQTCSCCGHRFVGENKLGLNDHVYHCPDCGMTLDRDENAAKNVYNLLCEQ